MEPTLLNFEDRGMVLSHADAQNPHLYRRAKELAAAAGQTLTIGKAVPKPWTPPENAYVLKHGATLEEVRAAHAHADPLGLVVTSAPAEWTGTPIREADGGTWVPEPNTIVISRHITEADFMRANETATRLGCKIEIAPDETNVPDAMPAVITPGLPVVIPRGASHSEYKRLKKLAEDRKVSYHVGA